jgi:toxin-antitoxin system PIN domain toxin
VKLLDANILLYAYDSDSAHHAVCRSWLEAAFNSEEVVALPWQTLLAFLRISTNSRATKKPLQSAEACEIVDSWLHQVNVSVIGAGERFWELLMNQIVEAQVAGPLVTDAALVALAFEHGATLCSVDRDYRRFRDLKLIDPTDQSEPRSEV